MKKQRIWYAVIILMAVICFIPGVVFADVIGSGDCSYEDDGSVTWTLEGAATDLTLTISGNGDMKSYTEDTIPWKAYRGKITKIIIGSGVNSIGQYAFYGCNAALNVTVPSSVTSIKNEAFDNCTNVKKVNISDLKSWLNIDFESWSSNPCAGGSAVLYINDKMLTEAIIPAGVTRIKPYGFYRCNNLKSVTMPDSVVSIDTYAFRRCSSLERVSLSENITGIAGYAFMNCISLSDIELPEGLTSIEKYTFSGCRSLKSIRIPESVLYIDYDAFADCINLKSVVISDGVLRIGARVFSGCSSLKEIDLPSSLTRIGFEAFSGCTGLTNIEIPDGVTYIYEKTFNSCSNLVSIVIPEKITNIDKNAFEYCSSLKDVYYAGTKQTWDSMKIESYNDSLCKADIHYNYFHPYASMNIYGSDCVYDGKAQEPELRVVRKGKTLAEGKDYTLVYKNNINAGTATVTVVGKGQYSGEMTGSYKIAHASISGTYVEELKPCSYSGKNLTPKPVVKKGSLTLIEGIDYTVTYSNNKNAGTAAVTIAGKGNFINSKEVTFIIKKAAQPMKAKAKSVSLKYKKVKAKKQVVSARKILTLKNVQGTKSFKKISGSKYLTVNKKNGKLTVRKGTPVGKYWIKVRITAKGNKNYKSGSKTVKVRVNIK